MKWNQPPQCDSFSPQKPTIHAPMRNTFIWLPGEVDLCKAEFASRGIAHYQVVGAQCAFSCLFIPG